MSNILFKAGFKLFSEPPWIVEAVFSVLCRFFAVVLGGMFDFPSTKIVRDLALELISVLTGCNCKRKILHYPLFYASLKNNLILKTILLTWKF